MSLSSYQMNSYARKVHGCDTYKNVNDSGTWMDQEHGWVLEIYNTYMKKKL